MSSVPSAAPPSSLQSNNGLLGICRLYITAYRYRVLPAKLRRYLTIQRQADAIYRTQTGHRTVYLRGLADRSQWLELHFFADEQTQHRCAAQLGADPQATALWHEFRATLDPTFPAAIDEYRHYAASDGDAPPAGFMDGG